MENVIVDYNDIFARHRLGIGINNNFKVKLTPKTDAPVYTQSLPVPINLKEDLTVELYSRFNAQIWYNYDFAVLQIRKPSAKLRLLVDLRKMDALISDDFINDKHPITTLSDAAQHLTGEKIFCKLDCSQG